MHEEVFGGVRVRISGGTDGSGGGDGPLVILLHGWGASGGDLVPLGDVMGAPPGTRFVFPEGPLSLDMASGGGRAWWLIDVDRMNQDFLNGRPRNLSKEVPEGLADARAAIVRLLDELRSAFGVPLEKFVLGGFSQGAMLACDVALRTELPLAGLALLSGTVLARDEWLPLMPKRKGLRVLQSHGTGDPMLPFFLAEQLRDFLSDAGLEVEWVGFQGGHEIPQVLLKPLGSFLHRVFQE